MTKKRSGMSLAQALLNAARGVFPSSFGATCVPHGCGFQEQGDDHLCRICRLPHGEITEQNKEFRRIVAVAIAKDALGLNDKK